MICLADSTLADVQWVWTVAGLLVVLALVALNGFFVAAEFALVGVCKTRVEEGRGGRSVRQSGSGERTPHLRAVARSLILNPNLENRRYAA